MIIIFRSKQYETKLIRKKILLSPFDWSSIYFSLKETPRDLVHCRCSFHEHTAAVFTKKERTKKLASSFSLFLKDRWIRTALKLFQDWRICASVARQLLPSLLGVLNFLFLCSLCISCVHSTVSYLGPWRRKQQTMHFTFPSLLFIYFFCNDRQFGWM